MEEEINMNLYVQKEEMGKCKFCGKSVDRHSLYVKENNDLFHFYCYNIIKKEELTNCHHDTSTDSTLHGEQE